MSREASLATESEAAQIPINVLYVRCWLVTVRTLDGSSLSALFKLK